MSFSTQDRVRVAVLHQEIEPPIFNGVRKPMKPGGYRDSGADIAYTLQTLPDVKVITLIALPDPASVTGWTFPDTPSGILSAVHADATHIWANTILFSSHPLQTLQELDQYEDRVRIVGQPPNLVQQYDDKEYVNNLLRSKGFTFPKSWTLISSPSLDIESALKDLDLLYPIVGKPIRGRGSSGVKLCNTSSELTSHIMSLFKDSPVVMLEEYLSGEECTVTIMPPAAEKADYWALPIVTRFNHAEGIAPYNGVIAVTANSRVVSREERENDKKYDEAVKECLKVARLLKITAPIRIDVRRFGEGKEERFALFDVNMKPNMTGKGRPVREDQTSLTGMAAEAIGWDYSRLLQEMLNSARILKELRDMKPV